MSTAEQRLQMAKTIIDFEARRDGDGHLMIYNLPANDGGGRYEVAGINERYDKPVADKLVGLIRAKKFDEAEGVAEEYIAANTDPAARLTNIPSVECILRDTVFNRGVRGCVKTLQHAIGASMDGLVGPETKAKMAEAEKNVPQLLSDIRDAREWYERNVVGYRANFWRGLTNRWNNSLKVAQTFPNESSVLTRVQKPLEPIPSAPRVPPAMAPAHQSSWWLDLLHRGGFARDNSTPDDPHPVVDQLDPPKPPAPPADDPTMHDLGHRVMRTVQALDLSEYPWWDKSAPVWPANEGELLTVSIEGMDPDGTPNQNRNNAFDDIKMVLDRTGKIVGGPWEATTAPGRYWTQHPMASGGAFIISKGPQMCWTPGPYHDLEVWRQAEDSSIYGTRDPDATFQRQGPPVRHGNIGIHHHNGYDLPRDNISNAAAGCQVIRLRSDQAVFMRITKTDPRRLADPEGFRLAAVVLGAGDLAA